MDRDKVFHFCLPAHWVLSKIGEVCSQPQYGYTTSSSDEGRIKLLRTTDITSGTINWETVPYCKDDPQWIEKYLLKDGDIVISRAGSVGMSMLVKKPELSVFASYLIRFRPFEIIIATYYFYLFLKSPFYWNNIIEKSLGIALPNVNASKLKEIEIPLAPLPEQRAIVAKLEQLFSELDSGVENLKKAKEQLKVYRQAVLKWAFEGKLTEEWRNRQKDLPTAETLLAQIKTEREEQATKTGKKLKPIAPIAEEEMAELPVLLKSWIWVRLDNLGILGRGKSKHRPRNDKKLFGGKYPFIQTGEVKSAGYLIQSFENTYSEFGLSQSKLWPIGTLCITIAANIAETAFLGIDACFPDSIVGFIGNEKIIFSKYIFYFFKGNQNKLEAFAPATAQKNINLNILENLIIPYCSLIEQNQIVQEIEDRLSVCDKLEETITQSLQKAESLRQSILKKAFEGKLLSETELEEVRNAPDWEPAEKLLERIKTEKEKTGRGK
jgi:type I restriction enzyme, S subunit